LPCSSKLFKLSSALSISVVVDEFDELSGEHFFGGVTGLCFFGFSVLCFLERLENA
jgi:hypothetical protein